MNLGGASVHQGICELEGIYLQAKSGEIRMVNYGNYTVIC